MMACSSAPGRTSYSSPSSKANSLPGGNSSEQSAGGGRPHPQGKIGSDPAEPGPIAAAINGDPVLAPGGDPEVAKLQQKLLALGFYSGTVDGISGKGTRAAIDAYRKATADMGIEAEPAVDSADETTASIAVPEKKPEQTQEKATVQKISTNSAQNNAANAPQAWSVTGRNRADPGRA